MDRMRLNDSSLAIDNMSACVRRCFKFLRSLKRARNPRRMAFFFYVSLTTTKDKSLVV